MSKGLRLLRILIREEMEFMGKHMGSGSRSLGSGSSAEVEIDQRLEDLKSIEGQIHYLENTPTRMGQHGDLDRLHSLKAQKADLEQQIKELQGVL